MIYNNRRKSHEKLKHFIGNLGCKFCCILQQFFFYNRNYRKLLQTWEKVSTEPPTTTVAQHFCIIFHLLKSNFNDQNAYYVTGKARFRVLIAKRTVLRRSSGRIEFLIQKQNMVCDTKNEILIDSLTLSSAFTKIFSLSSLFQRIVT